MDHKAELQKEYRNLTNNEPDRRWSVARLMSEISDVKEYKRNAAELKAKQLAAAEEAEARRQARIASRNNGDLAPWANNWFNMLKSDEKIVAYLTSNSLSVIAINKTKREEWATKFMKDPAYYLGWAEQQFANAAQDVVAQFLVESVAAGASFDDIITQAQNTTLRMAQHPERSTSATSNLMHLYTASAWAELYREMLDAKRHGV